MKTIPPLYIHLFTASLPFRPCSIDCLYRNSRNKICVPDVIYDLINYRTLNVLMKTAITVQYSPVFLAQEVISAFLSFLTGASAVRGAKCLSKIHLFYVVSEITSVLYEAHFLSRISPISGSVMMCINCLRT